MYDTNNVRYAGSFADEKCSKIADIVKKYDNIPDDALIKEIHIESEDQIKVVFDRKEFEIIDNW